MIVYIISSLPPFLWGEAQKEKIVKLVGKTSSLPMENIWGLHISPVMRQNNCIIKTWSGNSLSQYVTFVCLPFCNYLNFIYIKCLELTLAIGFLFELSSPSLQAAANLIHSRFCLRWDFHLSIPFSFHSFTLNKEHTNIIGLTKCITSM